MSSSPHQPDLPTLRGLPPPLRWSLPLMLIGLALIGILLQAGISFEVLYRQMIKNAESRCVMHGRTLASQLMMLKRQGGMERVGKEMSHLVWDHGFESAVVLDQAGTVSAGVGRGEPWHVPTWAQPAYAEVQERSVNSKLALDKAGQLVGFFSEGGDESSMWTLVVALDLSQSRSVVWGVVLKSTVTILFVSLVLSGVVWWALHRIVTKRLRAVLARAVGLGKKNYEAAALRGRDEFAEIDHALLEAQELIEQKEQILLESDQRHRAMLEAMPAPVMLIRGAKIEYTNDALLNALHFEKKDALLGKHPTCMVPEEKHSLILERMKLLSEGAKTLPPIEVPVYMADGSTSPFLTVSSSYWDSRGKAMQVVLNDISRQKDAEARQQRLANEIAAVAEAEKLRIGQDLHDDICQRLAALKMAMQDMEEDIADKAPSLMAHADAIVERLDEAIQTTRSLARGLSPVEIESGGLGIGLEALCRWARTVHGIPCQLGVELDLTFLSVKAATQLYRVAQECVTNAVKHGRATEARISVVKEGEELRLSVWNNGAPFPPAAAENDTGMGLPIMRHRAASIGGRVQFESSSTPPGVTVVFTIPLPVTLTTNHPTQP